MLSKKGSLSLSFSLSFLLSIFPKRLSVYLFVSLSPSVELSFCQSLCSKILVHTSLIFHVLSRRIVYLKLVIKTGAGESFQRVIFGVFSPRKPPEICPPPLNNCVCSVKPKTLSKLFGKCPPLTLTCLILHTIP